MKKTIIIERKKPFFVTDLEKVFFLFISASEIFLNYEINYRNLHIFHIETPDPVSLDKPTKLISLRLTTLEKRI